jgi:hypothetical protein
MIRSLDQAEKWYSSVRSLAALDDTEKIALTQDANRPISREEPASN